MTRALVHLARQADGGWAPVGVWLAVARFAQYRMLPGDARRETFARSVLSAVQPRAGDTWEDWLGHAVGLLSNGHDRLMVEVEPEPTLDALFRREVLGYDAPDVSAVTVATKEIPDGLGGWKKVAHDPTRPDGAA